MDILEQVEPVTESIHYGTGDLLELISGLEAYALTVKTQKAQKYLLDTTKQLKSITRDIDDCADAVYSKAEQASAEQPDIDRLNSEIEALREILREYIGATVTRQEQNYIKSRYGVDVMEY